MDQELDAMIQEAKKSGLPSYLHSELRALVMDHRDIWSTSFGVDPPASVDPMHVTLIPDEKTVIVELRSYLIQKQIDELDTLGLFLRNKTSQWACDPLIVPKGDQRSFGLR